MLLEFATIPPRLSTLPHGNATTRLRLSTLPHCSDLHDSRLQRLSLLAWYQYYMKGLPFYLCSFCRVSGSVFHFFCPLT
jgi:hypothetical protein